MQIFFFSLAKSPQEAKLIGDFVSGINQQY